MNSSSPTFSLYQRIQVGSQCWVTKGTEQEHRALLGFLKAEVQPGKSQVHYFPCQDRALSSPKAHIPLLDKDGLQSVPSQQKDWEWQVAAAHWGVNQENQGTETCHLQSDMQLTQANSMRCY